MFNIFRPNNFSVHIQIDTYMLQIIFIHALHYLWVKKVFKEEIKSIMKFSSYYPHKWLFYMGNIHSIWTSMVAKRGNWMNEKCEWECGREKGKVSAASEEFNEAYILSLKGNYGSFFLLLCHTRTQWWKWRACEWKHHKNLRAEKSSLSSATKVFRL